MSDRKWKRYLQQSLQQEGELEEKPHKLDETIKLCIAIMRVQKEEEEPRTGFVQYLSDIFRFEGIPVLGLQAAALSVICLTISTVADILKCIPVFMPLFVLAVMPVLFRCQYYGMNEMEAVTRASGAQITLAKLVLSGAANLVCITIFLFFVISYQDSSREIGQMILYCLVPYLVCMISLLRLIRLQRKEGIKIGIALTLGSCVFWGELAKVLPWLYETSAFGIWLVAFLFFAAFFIKEICFMLMMRKEGKMYGIST